MWSFASVYRWIVKRIYSDPNHVQTYASADSAPQGFAISRSPLICPFFLVAFGLCVTGFLVVPNLEQLYVLILNKLSMANVHTPQTLQFRPLFIAFACTFWVFAAGTWRQRFILLFKMSVGCIIAILLTDIMMIQVSKIGGPGPFSLTSDILTGYMALLLIAGTIANSVHLPSGVVVRSRVRRPARYLILFVVSIALAAILAIILSCFMGRQIEFLRNNALLGGLGPGLFLFTPTLMLLLFFLSKFQRGPRPFNRPWPSVGFLVAALNEATHIADCVRSLDNASTKYKGTCRLYIVDNGSIDDTVAIAKCELDRCRVLTGKILVCPDPGKAHALNLGLRHAKEEIIVRVDADTMVTPTLLTDMIHYFFDPTVGGVGGLPLPKDSSFILAKMRSVEVYYNVGFMRIGQGAIDAVTVIPGIMSAYRRDLLLDLEGFTEGLNGEDTDMTVRVGRLGYRIIVDPFIKIYSEAPRTLAHLREQRLRWSRSFLHVFARNKSSIRMLQGARGLWILPFGFIATFRRTVVIPILLYALIVSIVDPSVLFLRHGAAVGAVVVGPVFLMTVIVLLIYRKPGLLIYIPAYLILRLLRAYFALEMLFTLPLGKTTASAQAITSTSLSQDKYTPTTQLIDTVAVVTERK